MSSSSGKTKNEALVVPDSRKSQRQQAAKNRREERMKAYERNKRQWLLTKIGGAILALLVIGGLIYAGVTYAQDRSLNRVPDGVQSYAYAGGNHDDTFTAWPESPPVGGVHNNTWQKCAYYDGVINPGMAVHAMEHGAVWITYSPDLSQEEKDKLKQLADDDGWVLVSEYPGLQAPIVASAWGKQFIPESADSQDLKQFIRVFKNNPDNTPEYGATCATGSEAVIG
jgi:hypothetical protein